jgi:cytochrome c5
MIMRVKHVWISLLLVTFAALPATLAAYAQAAKQATAQAASVPAEKATATQGGAAATKNGQEHEDGERIFQQNCSRCHAAPEGFSPRISGTIVRHMRVRASLSRRDEQELLRFLNP